MYIHNLNKYYELTSKKFQVIAKPLSKIKAKFMNKIRKTLDKNIVRIIKK